MKMFVTQYPFSFETLGSTLDSFFAGIESRANAVIPKPEYVKTTVRNAVPRIQGNFNVDLSETDEALILTCDLPGFSREDISVKLIDAKTVVIRTEVCTESVSAGVYHLRERRSASGKRTILLPEEVTADGAKAAFRDGVLEIVLIKEKPEEGETIPVE
ncbi:MAG: Hsp20/alpha crystallin family protein [Methanocorpusculum sp.]|nr:Hsp20/alpha crystallin family protein [Methanocorpusculum sp.]